VSSGYSTDSKRETMWTDSTSASCLTFVDLSGTRRLFRISATDPDPRPVVLGRCASRLPTHGLSYARTAPPSRLVGSNRRPDGAGEWVLIDWCALEVVGEQPRAWAAALVRLWPLWRVGLRGALVRFDQSDVLVPATDCVCSPGRSSDLSMLRQRRFRGTEIGGVCALGLGCQLGRGPRRSCGSGGRGACRLGSS
jgi:hypothetical protein